MFPVEKQFTGVGPVIVQVGLGLTSKMAWQVVVHPNESATVNS
jgi:hypothetical protein